MFPSAAPLLTASLALLLVGGCGTFEAPVPSAPALEPVSSAPGSAATPRVTPTPQAGNVDGDRTVPELTIELVDGETIRATLEDAGARAWRLLVAGVGEREGDRWEILVETGDVGPVILATEIRAGRVVDEMDLSGFADGTAAAGGCHGTLPVCLSSDGFRLPQDGDGTFSVLLVLPEAGTPLTVTGGTAAWPAEPFELGPWTDTEPFAWGAQGA